MGTLVLKNDLERELVTLWQQVAEPMRKIVWVEKSHWEAELEQWLAHAEHALEEATGVGKGKFLLFINV